MKGVDVEEWSPQWAQHVVARIQRREFEDGQPQPQRVVVKCHRCGDEWQKLCTSGNARRVVTMFAQQHLHRDPMARHDGG